MPAKTIDSDFKIIAIKPGESCSPKLSKILVLEQHYYFYPGYKLDKQDNFELFPNVPDQLYSFSGGPKLNISAIAGQNGSGKSSVIELLFMAINNLGKNIKTKGDLKTVENMEVSIYFKRDGHYKLYILNEKVELYTYDVEGKLQQRNIYDKDIERFFYTVAVNYSHYAYNSLDVEKINGEDWLTPLFHKNDSYQTPIVINPYRKKGNININTENELVSQRLIANLLRPDNGSKLNFRQLTDNLLAEHLILSLNDSKDDVPLYEETVADKTGKTIIGYRLDMLAPNFNAVLNTVQSVININYNNLLYDQLEAKAEKGDRASQLLFKAYRYLVRN